MPAQRGGLAKDPSGALHGAHPARGDQVLGQVCLYLSQVREDGPLKEDTDVTPYLGPELLRTTAAHLPAVPTGQMRGVVCYVRIFVSGACVYCTLWLFKYPMIQTPHTCTCTHNTCTHTHTHIHTHTHTYTHIHTHTHTHTQVTLAYMKHLWHAGQRQEAFDHLSKFIASQKPLVVEDPAHAKLLARY